VTTAPSAIARPATPARSGDEPQPDYPAARFRNVQDLLMAISLANLSLCMTWHRLFSPRQMLMPDWSSADLTALGINVVWLSIVFLAVIKLSRRFPVRGFYLHNLLILYPLLLMTDLLRQTVPAVSHALPSTRNVIIGGTVVLLLLIALLMKWRSSGQAMDFVLAFMVFLLPIFFVRAATVVGHVPPAPQLAGFLPQYKSAPRVVWIIFDEMDPRYAFERRAKDLQLPEFDRLKSESVYLGDMAQAEHDTDVAMPSLVFGEHVSEIAFASRKKLWGSVEGSLQQVDLRFRPDVFSDARLAGFNTGIVGWFLPYCRLLAGELSACYTESMYGNSQNTLAARWETQVYGLTPLQSHLQHVQRYSILLQQAEQMAADPRIGLVLLHLPVPHGPGIYDRRHQELMKFGIDDSNWYTDNLALADRTLGEIRKAMEKAGLWDSSALLVSSDHKLRAGGIPHSEGRVPYFVKLAGKQPAVDYGMALNARITRPLIGAILAGKVATNDDLQTWLSTRRITVATAATNFKPN
jgi:hypothetical protein